MTRAAIYCRISRDREGAGLGVERQRQDCADLVESHGWTVVATYTDNDLSAYSGKPRPGYRQLLADIAAGRVDAVVAWHTDRLHRSPVELEAYIAACEKHDVPTHTVKAGPLNLATPSGRLVARQLGAVARYEVEHSIERQQRAKLQAAADGRWKGGRRPFGYEADGVTVREAEAAAVREACAAILAGASLRGLAQSFNDRGVTTSTGRTWTATELRKVLVRPRNAALMEHQGKIVGPASWPALVDEEQWRAVVGILADPGRRTQISSARRWLLSGLALCGVCGSPVLCTMLGGTRASVPSYTCKRGKHVVRNAAELEAFVSAVVVERLRRPDAADLLAGARADNTAALRNELLSLRQRRRSLAALVADGTLTEIEVRREAGLLTERISEIEAALSESGRGGALAAVLLADDPGDAWLNLDLDRRRAVLDVLLTVTIHRTRKGRPPGWKPGESYFNPSPESIEIIWKT